MTDLVNLLLTNRLVGYLLSITFAFRRTILFFLASYVNLVWGFFSLMIKYIAAKFHKRMMIQMVITSLFNLAFLFNIIDYIYIGPPVSGLARCGKSCRLRWMNYLRPNIKRGNYNKEEEEIIIRLHESLGNRYLSID